MRQRAQRKKKPRETSESLLEELAQHHGPAATVVEPAVPDPRKSRLPSDSLANKVLGRKLSTDKKDNCKSNTSDVRQVYLLMNTCLSILMFEGLGSIFFRSVYFILQSQKLSEAIA